MPSPIRRPSAIRLLAVPVLLAGCAAPQVAAPAAAEAEVRAVIDRLYETAEQGDWQAMGEILADDFELFTDQAASFDRGSYLELIAAEDLGLQEMELRDLEIHVADDGSQAWSRFTGYFVHSPDYVVETAETLVFERRDGRWQVVHSHASVQQLDGETAAAEGEEGG